jgi:hypothetical protein
VTTFLGVIAKPALTRWAAKMAAEYAVRERQEWQGLSTVEAVERIKDAPYRSSGSKRDLGSRVHETIDAHSVGRPLPPWPDDVATYMGGFQQFLADRDPKIEASEFTVYSRTHRYAGTGDMLAWIGGELWLLDVKTGKWAYPEAALQLSAYAHGEFIGVDSQEQPMLGVDRAGVLLLWPGEYRMLPLLCDVYDEDLFEGFLAARDLWHWQQHHSRNVFPPKED